MTDNTQTDKPGFYGLGIAPKLLAALDSLKFKIPTPIQQKAIPTATEGKDMVGIAQTGTGKTIAFAIPMIQRLAATEGKGLVLVPTRELALQVAEVFKQFAPTMGMQTVVIIGGESLGRQVQELRRRPRIIIATPGRMIDHIAQRTVNLADVRVLVLDEADRMFDMGFAPQIEKIIAAISKERQTMLFSATMPDAIMKLASRHMKLPIRIEVARPGTAADRVEQEVFVVTSADKNVLLGKLLDKYWGSVLLFVRTKHRAKKIVQSIRAMPHSAAEIHSNRSLAQRREALEGFKSGKYRVLVATDIAARGIDVTGIELVINYDLPDEDENYVHRIGRTGRAGQPGRAITFASPDQGRDVKNIERLLRMPLTVSVHPDMPEAKFGGPAGPRQPGDKRRPGEPMPRREPRQQAPRRAAAPSTKPSAPRQEPPQRQQPKPQERPQERAQGRPQGRPQERSQQRPQGRSSDRPQSRPQGAPARRPRGQGGSTHGPGNSRRDERGPNRYGVDPSKRSGVVSVSPYFDNEEPRRRDQRPARPPAQQAKPPQQPSGSWFSRFLKKNKKAHRAD